MLGLHVCLRRDQSRGGSVIESFDSFVTRLSLKVALKNGPSKGFAIEAYGGAPGNCFKVLSDKHFLTMCSKHPSRFEISYGANRTVSYTKQPGSLSLVPAGVSPVLRAESDFNLVVCALDSEFVDAFYSEMERRPDGELRVQVNFHDPAAQQLMALLLADANEDANERLYTDSLAQALAVRMLYQGKKSAPESKRPSV